MEVTGVAQRDAWLDHRLPPVENVGPGIWSIPLPNAESGIRYVLSHVVELDDGLAVVDPGWNDLESWDALVSGLAELGRTAADVRSIVITHSHPDHLGGADRLRRVSGATVLIHEAEMPLIPMIQRNPRELIGDTAPWLARHGSTVEQLTSFHEDHAGLASFTDVPRPDGFLTDATRLPWHGREVYAVHTPGHTPGHLCLHFPQERLLMTGDHLLPRITPAVSAFPRSGMNPLADYLDSLEKVAAFEVDEVLPAHEYRFAGLTERAYQVVEHHRERGLELAEALAGIGEPATAAHISERLTWSRPWEQILPPMRRAALAETVAHLVHLESRSVVDQAEVSGLVRWRLTR